MTHREAGRALCPSARCAPGNLLIGIVQGDGGVALLAEPMAVTAQFVATAREGRTPEARFRFADACHRGGCAKWDGAGCSVAAAARAMADQVPSASFDCAIRAACQWHRECGAEVCGTCHWIVTERAPT